MAEIQVTEDGAEVAARVGDVIVVRVPEKAGSGHRWAIASVGRGLDVVSDIFTPPGLGPTRAAPNADGEREVRVRAGSPGRAELILQYRRPWEAAPTRRFAIHVVTAT